jgi:hypothetical protein
MKILCSILAVIVGAIVSMVAWIIVVSIGHAIIPPPEALQDSDAFRKLMGDPEAMRKMAEEMQTGALVALLIAWQAAAFFGGGAAALSAGRKRCLHAGIIGFFVLLASVAWMMIIPHRDWMKVTGLLLPLPMSLLAGKLVSLLFPAPAPQPQLPVYQA